MVNCGVDTKSEPTPGAARPPSGPMGRRFEPVISITAEMTFDGRLEEPGRSQGHAWLLHAPGVVYGRVGFAAREAQLGTVDLGRGVDPAAGDDPERPKASSAAPIPVPEAPWCDPPWEPYTPPKVHSSFEGGIYDLTHSDLAALFLPHRTSTGSRRDRGTAPNARFALCWAWRDHPAQSSPSQPFEVAASSPSHRRPRPLPGVAAEPGEAQEPPPAGASR